MVVSQKVILALSGGVDSAIAAYYLKRDGCDVLGVYFDFWKHKPVEDSVVKTRIKNAAEKIGIPLLILDRKDYFYKSVIEPFILGLESGETPNPCVQCNPLVKFRLLSEIAEKEGAQFIATGHYARVIYHDENGYELYQGVDKTKDQSYVLAYLDQEILSKLILPLGNSYKSENILIANKSGLDAYISKESQDLCFVDSSQYKHFVMESVEKWTKSGPIFDFEGNKLGEHGGLIQYTIGQRKGIRISAPEPYYVARKDLSRNALIVGKLTELGLDHFYTQDIQWINKEPVFPLTCDVKIRYRAKPVMCTVNMKDGTSAEVKTFIDIKDLTPGQYAVFLEGERVLGAGRITEVGSRDHI